MVVSWMYIINSRAPSPYVSLMFTSVPTAGAMSALDDDAAFCNDEASEPFACTICYNVAYPYRECGECYKGMCMSCAEQLVESELKIRSKPQCPSCKKEVSSFRCNNTVSKLIQKLRVECKLCSTQMDFADLEPHRKGSCKQLQREQRLSKRKSKVSDDDNDDNDDDEELEEDEEPLVGKKRPRYEESTERSKRKKTSSDESETQDDDCSSAEEDDDDDEDVEEEEEEDDDDDVSDESEEEEEEEEDNDDDDDLEEDEEPTEGALLRSSSNGIPQTASSRKQATTTAAAAPSSAESAARRLLKKPDPSRHQNAMTYRLLDTGRRGRQSLQLSLMKKLGVS